MNNQAKSITVTLPIEEAVELIRLARAESRCLIENGDLITDIDIQKRTQLVLSARERMVSELEAFAGLEQELTPIHQPAGAVDLTAPNRIQHPAIDAALKQATTLPVDGGQALSLQHGVPQWADVSGADLDQHVERVRA